MKITEFNDYPVMYERFGVYPEYYTTLDKVEKHLYKDITKKPIKTEIIGIGKSYKNYTTVIIMDYGKIIGMRHKISIFTGEETEVSTKLEAFNVGEWRVGVVICREVLHTAIAEVYRMMKVNLLTVHIGGGEFYNLQRASWIDQMCLFSDIVGCPLVCASGADRAGGGINLLIER